MCQYSKICIAHNYVLYSGTILRVTLFINVSVFSERGIANRESLCLSMSLWLVKGELLTESHFVYQCLCG